MSADQHGKSIIQKSATDAKSRWASLTLRQHG
jgi:hypothetical protein